MIASAEQITARLREQGEADIAAQARRFFKTGQGEYGEGDRFLGLRVPLLRQWVKEYRALPWPDHIQLLQSPFHEARLLALLLLVAKYAAAGSPAERAAIYRLYLSHTQHINNWDLVDSSAEHIVGAHLFSRGRRPIYRLAGSRNLWERRIAVMSTFHFIKRGDFADTLALAELLLHDSEDLIHKAVGWMLREVGKRNRAAEAGFLDQYYRTAPRTLLRYAIEKVPEPERQAYLQGTK